MHKVPLFVKCLVTYYVELYYLNFISVLYQQDAVDSKRCLTEAIKEFRDGQHLFNQKVHDSNKSEPNQTHAHDINISFVRDSCCIFIHGLEVALTTFIA